MRCEIPHRCVRRKYRIRRHSPFRLRNCWEGRSVRASSLLRQLAKGGCAARRLSWVTPGFSQSRRCKTTASAKLACLQVDSRGSPRAVFACKPINLRIASEVCSFARFSNNRPSRIKVMTIAETSGYRARIRNHGHSCFLCEIVIRSQFHTTYEPEA